MSSPPPSFIWLIYSLGGVNWESLLEPHASVRWILYNSIWQPQIIQPLFPETLQASTRRSYLIDIWWSYYILFGCLGHLKVTVLSLDSVACTQKSKLGTQSYLRQLGVPQSFRYSVPYSLSYHHHCPYIGVVCILCQDAWAGGPVGLQPGLSPAPGTSRPLVGGRAIFLVTKGLFFKPCVCRAVLLREVPFF